MQANNPMFLVIIAAIVVLLLVFVFVMFSKRRRKSSESNEQIYIGNLPYRTNERDLRKRFSEYGQISDVRIVKDRRTGRSKGYAFITFSNHREAKKSLSEHGKELAGRSLVVHVAKPRD